MIVAASDVHGEISPYLFSWISKADLFVFAGDLASCLESRRLFLKYYGEKPPEKELKLAEKNDMEEARELLAQLESLDVPVCVVKGNAELYHTESLPTYEEFVEEFDVIDLDGTIYKHRGMKIGGIGFFHEVEKLRVTGTDTPDRVEKASRDEKRAEKKLKKLEGVDVLVSHDPPQGFLDLVTSPEAPEAAQNKHLGSLLLRRFVEKERPKFHVCGHIHEAQGEARLGPTTILNVGREKGKIVTIEGELHEWV